MDSRNAWYGLALGMFFGMLLLMQNPSVALAFSHSRTGIGLDTYSTNNTPCQADDIELLDKMNDDAAVAKTSRITFVVCDSDGKPAKIILRNIDCQEMEWTPSDGTNEFKRKLMLGR